MSSTLVWVVLTVVAYLVGSVPLSYLAAKWSRGIDLREYGTGQVGSGNLWRLTSWKLGLPVGLFDGTKGLWMVWIAQAAGLTIAQQVIVGLGAIAGHNWSVFLKFAGGRGVGTTLGVVLILPLDNDMSPVPTIVFFAVCIVGVLATRRSPVPVLVAMASLPVASWLSGETLSVTLAFLAIFIILIIGRLSAPRVSGLSIGRGELLLNRLLFDRDIRDRNAWLHRAPPGATPLKTGKQE